MKLNTDGCAASSPGQAGCGGIVRDRDGSWVSGFSRRIGITNSFVEELWGLRDGLILCNNLNIIFLLVELDTKDVVDILNRSNYVNNVVSTILDDCRLLASQFHRIQFKHYYHQAHRCADVLAKKSVDQELDFVSFESPLVDIFSVFEQDLNRMYFNRLCLELDVVH